MANAKRKGRDSLGRQRNTRKERERILIVAEGVQTEKQYFQRLAAHLRATGVTVCGLEVVGVGRDPMSVVRKAAQCSNDGKLIGHRDGYDAVWCVFDVDEHASLDNAVVAGKGYGFFISVSNPCFEIWLLWHFESRKKRIERSDLVRKMRQEFGIDKSLPRGFPYSKYSDAVERAGQSDGEVPGNPGSGVVDLVERLERSAQTRR